LDGPTEGIPASGAAKAAQCTARWRRSTTGTKVNSRANPVSVEGDAPVSIAIVAARNFRATCFTIYAQHFTIKHDNRYQKIRFNAT
jgi:hypothetical protein